MQAWPAAAALWGGGAEGVGCSWCSVPSWSQHLHLLPINSSELRLNVRVGQPWRPRTTFPRLNSYALLHSLAQAG